MKWRIHTHTVLLLVIKKNIMWPSLGLHSVWAWLSTVTAKEISDIIVIESDVLLKRKVGFEMQIRIYWVFYDIVEEWKNFGLWWEEKNDN